MELASVYRRTEGARTRVESIFEKGRCPWDLDGICLLDLDANGSVGVSDLLSLLASWGPRKGCSADFDGDGNVGASDLLALLANWGPCP